MGCDVSVKLFQGFQVYVAAGTKGEPFDAALVGWNQDYPDPYDFLDILLNGNNIHADNNNNLAYFNNAKVNSLLAAANKKVGAARYKAYGDLDVSITKNYAPWAAYDNRNERVPRRPELLLLRDVVAARPLGRERDARGRDAFRLEPGREPLEQRLLGRAAVAGSQDRTRHGRFAVTFFTVVFFVAGAVPLPPPDGFFVPAVNTFVGNLCASFNAGDSRSPTVSRRAGRFAIVNASGRPSPAISSQRSGALTGARRIGRTLYGPAVVLPRTFCR